MRKCDECRLRLAGGAEEPLPRRELLRAGAAGTAVVLASACGGTSEGAADAGATGDGAPGDASPAGDTGEAGEGGSCGSACASGTQVLFLAFAKYPALERMGGSAFVVAPGYADPVCQQDAIIVAQPSAGQYVALSSSCTHACCSVRFTGNDFVCPCHGSRYATDGNVTVGPAVSPLQKLAVCADTCGVYVTIP